LEPISEAERRGLELVSRILDHVSWDHFKLGEQPAQILEWLYLGDLDEAMNFKLLDSKNICATLNVINWWELTSHVSSRCEDFEDLASLYSARDITYEQIDSEDRLHFDLVGQTWPAHKRPAHSPGRHVSFTVAW